jgi:hypothetical protein
MATLAAYPAMMRRSRHRLGLRECRAAWSSEIFAVGDHVKASFV